jgi:hypothetical protein
VAAVGPRGLKEGAGISAGHIVKEALDYVQEGWKIEMGGSVSLSE